MAIKKGLRFPIEHFVAFPKNLFLLGEISADREYEPNPNKVGKHKRDELTNKLQWVAPVSDPDAADKAKRASFEVVFLADVVPVPTGPELAPGSGLRIIELEGLTVEPKVMGQGEYKYQGYTFFATGIKGDTNAPKTTRGNAGDPKAGA